jgi:hypothetical protein
MMPVPHPYSTTVRAQGGHGARNRRLLVTPQIRYWRETTTELHAGATATLAPHVPGGGFIEEIAIPGIAAVGPQGAGERWLVDLIQVRYGGLDQQPTAVQVNLPDFPPPPLVVQQIAAQQAGVTTPQPPPVIAQAWWHKAGVYWSTGKLLAQTSQGANDSLSVSCPLVTPGEMISVVWYGWFGVGTHGFPWMSLSGTRYALSDI